TFTVIHFESDVILSVFFFFSSRRRHTRFSRDWSSDVCSSDLTPDPAPATSLNPTGFSAAASCLRRCLKQDDGMTGPSDALGQGRSEERRVGKECRRWRWRENGEQKKKGDRHGTVNRRSK